jgi:DNA-binding NtrC family response regulator
MEKSKILVVDDEEKDRQNLNELLGGEYEVLTAQNGDEALRILEKDSIDCVLLDVIMPGTDGFFVLKDIKHRRHRKIPVIMVSIVNKIWTHISAIEQGAYNFVTKPYDDEVLLNIIAYALKKRKRVLQQEKLINQRRAFAKNNADNHTNL